MSSVTVDIPRSQDYSCEPCTILCIQGLAAQKKSLSHPFIFVPLVKKDSANLASRLRLGKLELDRLLDLSFWPLFPSSKQCLLVFVYSRLSLNLFLFLYFFFSQFCQHGPRKEVVRQGPVLGDSAHLQRAREPPHHHLAPEPHLHAEVRPCPTAAPFGQCRLEMYADMA